MTFLFFTIPFSSWTLNPFLLLKKLAEIKVSCFVQVSLWPEFLGTRCDYPEALKIEGFLDIPGNTLITFFGVWQYLWVLGLSPWYFYSCLKLSSFLWTLSSPSMSLLPRGAQNCPQDLGGRERGGHCPAVTCQREFQAGILQLFLSVSSRSGVKQTRNMLGISEYF